MLLMEHEMIEDVGAWVRGCVGAWALALMLMGPAARRLLVECVEHQGCSRTAISKAGQELEDAGSSSSEDSGLLSVEKVQNYQAWHEHESRARFHALIDLPAGTFIDQGTAVEVSLIVFGAPTDRAPAHVVMADLGDASPHSSWARVGAMSAGAPSS
jgi:hypothetical protein